LKRLYLDVRIDLGDRLDRRDDLWSSHIIHVVEDLALQVTQVHNVGVDDAEATDAGSSQVEGCRGTQAARPNEQGRAVQKLALPFTAHLREDDVATVATNLLFTEWNAPPSHSRDQDYLVPVLERGSPPSKFLHRHVIHIDIDMTVDLSNSIEDMFANTWKTPFQIL